jgi:hypothetical protein
MLVVGADFFLWGRLSPLPEEDIVRTLEEEDANTAAEGAEGSFVQ